MINIGITAAEARGLTESSNESIDLKILIIEAASAGKEWVEYKGRLHPDIINALVADRFKVTWDPDCKSTWIWWRL